MENQKLPNFVKRFIEDITLQDVNREFTTTESLDCFRIDAFYNNFSAVMKDSITYKTTFNAIFTNAKTKIKMIEDLEKHLKDLKNKIREEK